jgi:hypothetical protein
VNLEVEAAGPYELHQPIERRLNDSLLDPRDERLRDVGPSRELPLGEARASARLTDKLGRIHVLMIHLKHHDDAVVACL